ncbi:hypothetical protein PFISCL1PPCAC_11982, partial [Pristionchus fissidentatus]
AMVSAAWQFFARPPKGTPYPYKLPCRLCGVVCSVKSKKSGTSNLKRHVAAKHEDALAASGLFFDAFYRERPIRPDILEEQGPSQAVVKEENDDCSYIGGVEEPVQYVHEPSESMASSSINHDGTVGVPVKYAREPSESIAASSSINENAIPARVNISDGAEAENITTMVSGQNLFPIRVNISDGTVTEHIITMAPGATLIEVLGSHVALSDSIRGRECKWTYEG